MKKVIILSLSCFLLASCTFGLSEPSPLPQNEGTGTTAKSGSIEKDYKSSIDTASKKITSTQEFSNCMQTSANMCIQSVGMQLAQKNKDVSLCDEFQNIDQKESCKFGIIMTDALEKQNLELCKTLSENYAKQCSIEMYRSQAQKNKDTELCKKIDEIANQGTGSTSQNTTAMMMGGADQCIFTVIMSDTGSTTKDCNKIGNDSMQEMCKTSIKNRPKMITPTQTR